MSFRITLQLFKDGNNLRTISLAQFSIVVNTLSPMMSFNLLTVPSPKVHYSRCASPKINRYSRHSHKAKCHCLRYPRWFPGITEVVYLSGLIKAYNDNSMATDALFARAWHGYISSLGYRVRFEGWVHIDTKDNWISVDQTLVDLSLLLNNSSLDRPLVISWQ